MLSDYHVDGQDYVYTESKTPFFPSQCEYKGPSDFSEVRLGVFAQRRCCVWPLMLQVPDLHSKCGFDGLSCGPQGRVGNNDLHCQDSHGGRDSHSVVCGRHACSCRRVRDG